MRRSTLTAGFVAGFVFLAGCSGEAGPGELEATLVSPSGAEGAVVLEISGVRVSDVTAPNGRVFSNTRGDVTRIVVVLDVGDVIQFRFFTDDTSNQPQVTIIEVAGAENQLRESLGGYRFEFRRVRQ